VYCGRRAPDVVLTVDHVYPKSKGGKNSEDNLVAACKDCNSQKSDVVLSEVPEVVKRVKRIEILESTYKREPNVFDYYASDFEGF
jgi:5-methylcytosine-specific restriction endonuclease McrA